MTKKAIITVGLGFGDEGKGVCVARLCHSLKVDLVVRYSGGCQAGHNVYSPQGERHPFSQFGAGTFQGVPTYLGDQFILDPFALLAEAANLQKLGISNPLSNLTIHSQALITTPFHKAVNRLQELSRGDKPHGSCGLGIGEVRQLAQLADRDSAVRVADLSRPHRLGEKLDYYCHLRNRVVRMMLMDHQQTWPGKASAFRDARNLFYGESVTSVVEQLVRIGEMLKISTQMPLPTSDQRVVFEGAQGVLIDEAYGFHPHTTWGTVTPKYALQMAHDLDLEPSVMGVMRAYMTRHGAGPFPTEVGLSARDLGNPPNDWQGPLRYGHLDLILIRYAIAACGGIDCLAVNCLDGLPLYTICEQYEGSLPIGGCGAQGRWTELRPAANPTLEGQKALGEALANIRPLSEKIGSTEFSLVCQELAPVVIKGQGPETTSCEHALETL